jgi:hypothetical protein
MGDATKELDLRAGLSRGASITTRIEKIFISLSKNLVEH